MRQAYTKTARAGCTSGQRVLKANHGLLLLTGTLPCSQAGFTKHDDGDLLATRAKCVDVYNFPNDQSDDSGDNIVTTNVEKGKCTKFSTTTNAIRGATLGSVCRAGENKTSKRPAGNKMSSVEHQAIVDKGLKMKIKKKIVGAKAADSKHEIVKNEGSRSSSANSDLNSVSTCVASVASGSSGNMADNKALKHGVLGAAATDKEKSPKVKNAHKKEKGKDKATKNADSSSSSVANGGLIVNVNNVLINGHDMGNPILPLEPKVGEVPSASKKEPVHDPYEFNAKEEDGIGVPMKKIKVEKVESATSPVQGSSSHDASTDMCSVGVSTDPECLGPCEPGTSVTLEGIVWHETENGVLVVNVTWRGKTYVGTLLDATKHDWAPPRLNCDSPVSDLETVRTPKGRGKRGRGTGTPVNDRTVGVAAESRKLRKGRRTSNNANGFQAPASPAKTDVGTGAKRKGRPELEPTIAPKRSRSSSRGAPPVVDSPSSALIECAEPNCNKKYKHINGLRYHQTHAHQNSGTVLQQEEMEVDSKTDESELVKESDAAVEASKDTKATASAKNNKEQDSDSKKCEKSASKSDLFKDTTRAASPTATKQSRFEEAQQAADSEKSESGHKKKDLSVSTGSTATSNSMSKSSLSPQVYPLASAPIGCLGSIPASQATASSSASVHVTTTSLSSSTSSAPTNVNTSPSSGSAPFSEVGKPEGGKDIEKVAGKGEKSEKSKTKTSARPIMPAPSPQMMSMSTSVPVTHSNLAPVSTHAQMSPSLKPIQPKPTIMGEPSSVNPALVGLKDKKPKSKKRSSRDKDKDSSKSNSKDGASNKDEAAVKCERTGVIKALASPAKSSEGFKKDGSLVETSKLIAEARRSVAATGLMSSSQLSPNLPEPGHGSRLPQSGARDLGKIGSPLRVNTPDRKSPLNEEVQSPAYSDISDANDTGSASSATEEVPQKPTIKREESENKKDDNNKPKPQQHPQAGGDSSNMGQYGMYSYYPRHQTPYMMQNVQQPHNLSQNSQKSAVGNREEAEAKSQQEAAEGKKKETEHPQQAEVSEDVKPKLIPPPQQENGPPGGPGRQPMTPQQMQDYQAHQVHQQKWLQQMYALQTLPPQYQYLAAYGYAVDPTYHMHLMSTDPHYRQQYEKIMEEQKRSQEERYKAEERGEQGKDGPKRVSGDDGRQGKFSHQPQTPKGPEKPADLRRTPSVGGHDNDVREQNLREKQSENHQIMKENIELKSQMDREKKHEFEAAYRMQERHEDELRRFYMYQQQKMLLQQRMGGDRKMDISGKVSEPSPGKGTPGDKLGPDIKPHMTGVEHSGDSHRKDLVELKSRDHNSVKIPSSSEGGKSGEDSKPRVGDKMRSEDPRTPRSGYPGNISRGSPSTCAMTPTSSALAQAPYASYISYPNTMQSPYMQSPYGHQMPFDPNHPMYHGMNPSMIGYAQHANSNYLHPSQLGYRNAPGEVDEKAKSASHPSVGSPSQKVVPLTPESDPKAVELLHQGSPYYQGHKIHELQEKGRSSSRSSPPTKVVDVPAALPAAAFDKQRDLSTNSPPTQRHVHTHHHTHVLGGFPVYGPGPYGAPIIGQQSSSATTSPVAASPAAPTTTPSVPHPFPSK